MNNQNNINPMGPPNYNDMQQMQYQQNIKDNNKSTNTALIVALIIIIVCIICCCCCGGALFRYSDDISKYIESSGIILSHI